MKPSRRDHIPGEKLKNIFSKTVLNGSCMEWTGNYFYRKKDKAKTYPYLYFKGKVWRGNRLVLFLTTGIIGDLALHKCDNSKCVNPDHLYWGTPQQNVRDAYERGRAHNQKITHCKWGHEYTKQNTLVSSNGRGLYRRCKHCMRIRREGKKIENAS